MDDILKELEEASKEISNTYNTNTKDNQIISQKPEQQTTLDKKPESTPSQKPELQKSTG